MRPCGHKSCEHKPYEQKLCGKIKENRLEMSLFFYGTTISCVGSLAGLKTAASSAAVNASGLSNWPAR